MSDVLVLAEVVDGAVAKPTLELLTLAGRIGDARRRRSSAPPTRSPQSWGSTAPSG